MVLGIVGDALAEINHGNTASRFMALMRLCDYTFLNKKKKKGQLPHPCKSDVDTIPGSFASGWMRL